MRGQERDTAQKKINKMRAHHVRRHCWGKTITITKLQQQKKQQQPKFTFKLEATNRDGINYVLTIYLLLYASNMIYLDLICQFVCWDIGRPI